jgi:hypothetical protein
MNFSDPMVTAAADSLEGLDLEPPSKFSAIGIMSSAGVMKKITFAVPFVEVADRLNFDRLLERHDFDMESLTTPGQRDISEKHAEKIADFILASDRPFLGTLTIAMPEGQVDVKQLQVINKGVSLVKLSIPVTSDNPIVEDGQHRVKGIFEAWQKMQADPTSEKYAQARETLEHSSIEMTLLLESDPSILSTIFVKMASTRPISASLIAIMDSSAIQNRLGQKVTRRSAFLAGRTTYLGAKAARSLATAKGREYDPLYPAAAVRSAASAIAGVGVRDRTPAQREDILTQLFSERAKREEKSLEEVIDISAGEIVQDLDYAFTRIPGWDQMSSGKISALEFKSEYVHSSAAGLHVIANVIAAGRLSGLDIHQVIDALAALPWRRDDLREITVEGEMVKVHELFEDTLVRTSFDVKTGSWKAGQAGATRGAYEEAIRKALTALARGSEEMKALQDTSVLTSLGLISAGRGRPRKS